MNWGFMSSKIRRIVINLPLTLWLCLMPILGMRVQDFLAFLPVFFVLDFIRESVSRKRETVLPWLTAAYSKVRFGQPYADFPALKSRFYYNFAVWALPTYAACLVIVLPLRRLVAHVAGSQWVLLYNIIGKLYPFLTAASDYSITLGHAENGYELKHFFCVCVVGSIVTLFLLSGPFYVEFVQYSFFAGMKRRKAQPPQRVLYSPVTSLLYLAFGLGWLLMLNWLVWERSVSPNIAKLDLDMRAAVLMLLSIPMFLYLSYAIVFLILWFDLRSPPKKW